MLHLQLLQFRILCNFIVGTGVVRTTVTLITVFSGTHFREYYVITVFWDVT